MAKKGRQASKKKPLVHEEEDKQNETILEEVLSISGKNAENEGSPAAKQKKPANQSDEATPIERKKAPKRSVAPASLPSKKKKLAHKEEDEKAVDTGDKVDPSTLERGDPVPNLPEGWRRQAVVRKSGKSAGHIDIYFYSPEGVKLRSRPEIASYLKKKKSALKLDEFDFSKTTQANDSAVKKTAVAENSKVLKKKTKVEQELSAKKAEPDESSKNLSTKNKPGKGFEELPLAPDTEEKALSSEKEPLEINREPKERMNSNFRSKKQTRLPIFNKVRKSNQRTTSKLIKSSKKLKEKSSAQPKKNQIPRKPAVKGKTVPNLPGWRKEIVVRKSGIRAGQEDVYFYSPEGIRLRSRPEVVSYLQKKKTNLKSTDFDFSRKPKKKAVSKKANTVQGGKSKNLSKNLSAKVPQEKNYGKSKKILKKIVESKSKK